MIRELCDDDIVVTRQPYLHESRHQHALRRPRGPGGRFLTVAEQAELRKSEAHNGHGDGSVGNRARHTDETEQPLSPISKTPLEGVEQAGDTDSHEGNTLPYPANPFVLDDLYSNGAPNRAGTSERDER